MNKMGFVSASLGLLLACIPLASAISKEDEKAVQALTAAADELASEVAKVNKRHSKEYFKKRIGEIFIQCSKSKSEDKMACIKPKVEALAKE